MRNTLPKDLNFPRVTAKNSSSFLLSRLQLLGELGLLSWPAFFSSQASRLSKSVPLLLSLLLRTSRRTTSFSSPFFKVFPRVKPPRFSRPTPLFPHENYFF